MNKEQLEKMFDERFNGCYINKGDGGYICDIYIKQFIFETIIPEVLKSILVDEKDLKGSMAIMIKGYNYQIKQQAKLLYNITL